MLCGPGGYRRGRSHEPRPAHATKHQLKVLALERDHPGGRVGAARMPFNCHFNQSSVLQLFTGSPAHIIEDHRAHAVMQRDGLERRAIDDRTDSARSQAPRIASGAIAWMK